MEKEVFKIRFGGLSFLNILFLVFLILKLTKVINWSWWWITAPLWGQAALVLGAFLLIFLGYLIAEILATFRKY